MCARSFFTFQTLGWHKFGESLRVDRLVSGVNASLLFQRISLHCRFCRFLHVAGNFGELFIWSAHLGRHKSEFKLWVDMNLVSRCTLIVSCVVLMLISSFDASLCITGFVGSSTSLAFPPNLPLWRLANFCFMPRRFCFLGDGDRICSAFCFFVEKKHLRYPH